MYSIIHILQNYKIEKTHIINHRNHSELTPPSSALPAARAWSPPASCPPAAQTRRQGGA